MAATLLSAPSLGDSDWSGWITLVDTSRRGYMALTYTNFAASAESAVAAGSLLEVAGALYSFTETSIDFTGAGSANSDLYIYVMPDAVISTATVVAWGSAPVWVDAKQGFYASAASTTRAIGGIYVGTAATYYYKWLYTGELLNYCVSTNKTRPVLKYISEIGEWNMDADSSKSIALPGPAHTGTTYRIIDVSIIILSDGYSGFPIDLSFYGSATAAYWTLADSPETLELIRIAGGYFDSVSFNGTASTIPNRGWVIFQVQA